MGRANQALAGWRRIYSCYWSPNSTFQEFQDFLSKLEISAKSSKLETIISGDFNAHHVDWGSRFSNKRGEALSNLISSLDLIICNIGKKPTFQNSNGTSIVDLTLATPALANGTIDWKVLDILSLSDHNYITFSTILTTCAKPDTRETWTSRRVDCNIIRSALESEHISIDENKAEQCAMGLIGKIQDICKQISPARPASSHRKSVYWWTQEISNLRKTANHLRRVHQRKLKRVGPDACRTEKEEAKEAKSKLVKEIKRSKEQMWKKLCDEVEQDPWGRPYKLVMGKIIKPQPIPELNTPGRLEEITNGLFPQHLHRNKDVWSPLCNQQAAEARITVKELKTAASRLKKNAALGPDGITNDVLKYFAYCKPDIMLKVFNLCITEGLFPKIWKIARLALIRKGDKPLDTPSSYRPLCILDTSGKLLEKILDNRLRKFLEDNNHIDQRQYGFRKGLSTTDAVRTLINIVETNGPKKKIGVLTLDIKNAFNSAPWKAILEALQAIDTPEYLCRLIGSYLEDRELLINLSGNLKREELSSGVPQGSVLGPTLWNVLYNGLLRNRLPIGVSFLAFADDVALVAEAKDSIALGHLLSKSAEIVQRWLLNIGLELATHKSEALIITKTRTHNTMTISIDEQEIKAEKSIKYLGLQIDCKLNFTEHANITAAKANKVAQNIRRILPNISMAKPTKRKLISSVVQSILLYGTPNWADRMNAQGKKQLMKVQRKTALRIILAYSTVSTEATNVLADLPPIDLLANERRHVYLSRHSSNRPEQRAEGRRKLLEDWQGRWDAATTGRWTHRLISKVEPWYTRKQGKLSFHLTQAMTGHGCFSSYLHKIGKQASPACWYCDGPVDDAEHTIFRCDAWYHKRTRLEHDVGERIEPENMVAVMLRSKEDWNKIRDFCKSIITKKEEEERRREILK